jgi:hypothetical protein
VTRDELIAVLRSWQDFVPLPLTWTGMLQQRGAESGPAAARITCPSCEGSGESMRRPCPLCRGRKTIIGDAYVGRIVKTAEATYEELLQTFVDCDGCGGDGYRGGRCATACGATACQRLGYCRRLCERCEGSGRVPALLSGRVSGFRDDRARSGDRVLDALQAQHDRRDQGACYRAVAVGLDELPSGLRALIVFTYVLEGQPATGQAERGVDRLLGLLPETLRAPRWLDAMSARQKQALASAKGRGANGRAQAARNRELHRRREQGATLSELAAEYGLDASRVSRIVRGG